MRILYFSQYFPPEVGATQTRAYEMSRYLAARGHNVTVVTEVPNHPSGIIPPPYRGRFFERRVEDGVDVLRLWVWAAPEKSFKSRMRFYLSYLGMASLAGSMVPGRYDLVYATSPPLFTGAAGLAASTLRRIPFVFEVRDLWPESAVALGELSNPRAIRAAERLESLLYCKARQVVAVTHGIKERLVARGVEPSRIELIPNGANTDLFRFTEAGRRLVRQKLCLDGQFVAMYAGIHGIAQGLETLLEAADLLRDQAHFKFVFVGEGPRKRDLANMADALALANVTMLPEVAATEMPAYLSAADCAIVPLRNEPLFRGALPSKMFEAWACSRPVVLSVRGEAESILTEAGGGLAIAPENSQALAGALRELATNSEAARQMGARGRQYVAHNYSRHEQARALEEVLLRALEEDRAAGDV
jgi:glycosyltransferase involved in cell wall biosynthesis